MLTIYRDSTGSLKTSHSLDLPASVIWIDLFNPTDEEKSFVEAGTNVRIPTKDALNEIESSSRLIVRDETIYLSAPNVAQGDTTDPFLSPVGFILSAKLLITIWFAELPIFNAVADRVARDNELRSGAGIFTALMEALVDRGADVQRSNPFDLVQMARLVLMRRLCFAVGHDQPG